MAVNGMTPNQAVHDLIATCDTVAMDGAKLQADLASNLVIVDEVVAYVQATRTMAQDFATMMRFLQRTVEGAQA